MAAPEFRPIGRRRGYLDIVDQLRALVDSGQLADGARLPPERLLAEKLGTSRPTLREALVALEILGYVDIVNGKGTFIRVPGGGSSRPVADVPDDPAPAVAMDVSDSPFHLLELRKAVEPVAAALAAERVEAAELDAIEERMRAMERGYVASGRFPSEEDNQFHILIAAATHNPLFESVMQGVVARMTHPLWSTLKGKAYMSRTKALTYLDQHRAIVRALRLREPDAAHRAALAHLEQVEADLLES